MSDDLESYARYAYEAHWRILYPGSPTEWDQMTTEIQRAWIAAADAVLDTARSVGDL